MRRSVLVPPFEGSIGRALPTPGRERAAAMLIEVGSKDEAECVAAALKNFGSELVNPGGNWRVIVQDLRFSTDPATPFSIMGLELTRSQAGKPRWLPLRQVD